MEAQNQTPKTSTVTLANGGTQAGTWQCPIKFGSPEDWLLRRLVDYPDCVLVAHYPATTRENPIVID